MNYCNCNSCGVNYCIVCRCFNHSVCNAGFMAGWRQTSECWYKQPKRVRFQKSLSFIFSASFGSETVQWSIDSRPRAVQHVNPEVSLKPPKSRPIAPNSRPRAPKKAQKPWRHSLPGCQVLARFKGTPETFCLQFPSTAAACQVRGRYPRVVWRCLPARASSIKS